MQLHVYLIDDCDFCVAESEADALVVAEEYYGASYRETTGEDAPSIALLPDDKVLQVYDEEGSGERHTKTCREWADARGRGFLCSSNY